MQITHLKTNRIENPLGFALGQPSFSWIVEDTPDPVQTAARFVLAEDPACLRVLFDSGKQAGNAVDSLAYRPALTLAPRTRYYWKVQVWGATESAESAPAWFETAKMDEPWQAQWINADFASDDDHPVLLQQFALDETVVSARAYLCGLGVYHFALNGAKVGDEFLAPGCNAYDQWLQYQTYDITAQLAQGKNEVAVMLGNGWYKGRYGFQSNSVRVYGSQFALICEIHLRLANGQERVICSDLTWQAAPSPVTFSDIYDGEILDARIQVPAFGAAGLCAVKAAAVDTSKLEARRSLPVCINEEHPVAAVITTPAGETVLDMGQNMVGWLRIRTRAAAGSRIYMQFGEVLQNGNFYRDNLRSAKAEYTYIAAGGEAVFQPYFTFYGFRYVKVSGWEGALNPADFTGCVVYSKMDITGAIETSNAKVNQLFQNAMWGQKGNFLDIPTDCPQRDERMGWTGDTQMFSGTACFNMDSGAFFSKYGYDVGREQSKAAGRVPMVVPAAGMNDGGSSAWGDVATVVPWNHYQFYGDPAILEQQFESMRSWVDFIKAADEGSGGRRLWTTGFHFGDWLSLDGPDPKSPMGGTPVDFISSAYYCYSAGLTARAAAVIGKTAEAAYYANLAGEVKAAIQREYFTATGRLAIGTQTAHVLALFMDLTPAQFRSRTAADLVARLREDRLHLRTGFVGTPYLCRVLTACGQNEIAYRLLLNEDYPSWLYAINLGATTIWERWNSLNPDGMISDTGMNSLNHYSYGSIVEWMYRDVCGLNPAAGEVTGFRQARIAPRPHHFLQHAKAVVRTAAGTYVSGWSIDGQGGLTFEISVPFNAAALAALPDAPLDGVLVNGAPAGAALGAAQNGADVELRLPAGQYRITYQPTRPYYQVYSTNTMIIDLIQNPRVVEVLKAAFPMFAHIDPGMLSFMGTASLREMAAHNPMVRIPPEALDAADRLLAGITAG